MQHDLANSRGQKSRCVRLASELKQIDDLEAKMNLMKKEDSTLSAGDISRPTTRNTDTPQNDLSNQAKMTFPISSNRVSPRSAHKCQRTESEQLTSPRVVADESSRVSGRVRPTTSRHDRGHSRRNEENENEQIDSIAE